MSNKNNVSISVIRRLPRYYRFLNDLLMQDVERISSDKLANIMGVTAPQIRQDLNCFGGFGQQGYGYNVLELKNEISKILGIKNKLDTILIGVGNLGRAILTHIDFDSKGFNFIAAFDKDSEIIGKKLFGKEILDINNIDEFFKINKPVIAILCIPKSESDIVYKKLISLGIKGFWNFSHFDLSVDNKDIIVENVHLEDSLLTLCYRVNELK